MKLTEFKEQTTVYAKNQPDYLELPAHVDSEGVVTCCWKLNWKDRFKILFTGAIWHSVLTFNQPLQPQKLTIEKPDLNRLTG